jgi:quinohemoprotein ethanol dehydrogenase
VSGSHRNTANLAEGKRLFVQACVVCHGEDGKGGHGAGAPLDGVRDLADTIQTVTAGRNNMPPFRTALTPEQIRDVSGYVIEVLAGGHAAR